MTEQQSRPQAPGAEEPTPTVVVEPTLRTGAGIPLTTEVTVTNTSAEPRVLSVMVLGVDSAWLPEPVTTPLLAPGATFIVPLTLHPAAGTVPAQYPVAVTVQSLTADGRASGASPGVTNTVLVVSPRAQISMEITPPSISAWRRKRFAVELRNTGGGVAKLTLKPISTSALRVGLIQRQVEVPAGTTIRVKGHATARHPMVLGIPMRQLIRVEATGTEARRHADGEFTQNSLLPPFLLKGFVILAILSVWIGAGIVFLPRLTNVFGGAQQLTTATIQHVTTTKKGGGKGGGGSNNGSGGSGGSGGGSGGGKGSGGSGGSGGTGGSGGSKKPKGVQLNGTVQAADPAGVHVTLTPTSLVNEQADLGNGNVKTVGFSESLLTNVGKISPAAMVLTVAPSRKPQTRGLITGADGSWSFAHVSSPGYYLLTFDKPGYQVTSYVIDSTSAAASKPLPVPLAAGQGSLSGTVTGPNGKPVGGATITISDGTSTLTASSDTTGNIGHWSVTGLSTPATYTVSATASGLSNEAKDVQLAAGGSSTVDLSLRTGVATLSGTVLGPDSTGTLAGLPGATVTVSDGQNVTRTATTITENNLQGSYLVPGLPVPGTYTVTLSAPGYQDQVTKLTLNAGQGSAKVDATLPSSAGVVEGKVTDKNGGTGLPSAGLVLSNSTNTYKTTTTSATPGQFRINGVAPGTYTLTTELFDYNTDQLTVTVGQGGDVTVDPVLTKVPGGVLPATSTITGSAIDANTSKPITSCASASDACLTATITYPKNSSVAPVKFGASEQYSLTGLLPGAYQVTISAPGYEVAQVSVTVGLAATVTAPAAPLYPAPHISGAVLSNMSGQVPTGPVCVFAVPNGGTDVPSACPSGAAAGRQYTGSTCTSTASPTATSTNCYVTDAADSFKYDITLADHGGYTVYVIASDTDWVPSQPAPFTVAQGATVPYNPSLDRYGNVVVTVKQPQSGVLVLAAGVSVTITDTDRHAVDDAQGNPIGSLTTSSSGSDLGTVTVPPLTPGTYVINTSSGGTTAQTTIAVVDNQKFQPTLVLSDQLSSFVGQVTSSVGTVDASYQPGTQPVNVSDAVVKFTAAASWDATGNAQYGTVSLTTANNGCFALLTATDYQNQQLPTTGIPSGCASDFDTWAHAIATGAVASESFVSATATVTLSASGFVNTSVAATLNGTTPPTLAMSESPTYLTTDGQAPGSSNLLHLGDLGWSSPNWPTATSIAIVPPPGSGLQASAMSFGVATDSSTVGNPAFPGRGFSSSASLSFTDTSIGTTPATADEIYPGDYQLAVSVTGGFDTEIAILSCRRGTGCRIWNPYGSGGDLRSDNAYNNAAVIPIHQDGAIAILPVYADSSGNLQPITGATPLIDGIGSPSTSSGGFQYFTGVSAQSSTGDYPTYSSTTPTFRGLAAHSVAITAAGYLQGTAGSAFGTNAATGTLPMSCSNPQTSFGLSLATLRASSGYNIPTAATDLGPATTQINIAEGEYTYCEVELTTAPSITGQVKSILVPSGTSFAGQLAGATVTATCSQSSACGSDTYTAVTDGNGNYTLQGTATAPMRTGTYTVSVADFSDGSYKADTGSGATTVSQESLNVSVDGPNAAGPLSLREQGVSTTFMVTDPRTNPKAGYTDAAVTITLTNTTTSQTYQCVSDTGGSQPNADCSASAGSANVAVSDFYPGVYKYTLTSNRTLQTTGSGLTVTFAEASSGTPIQLGPVTLATVNAAGTVTGQVGSAAATSLDGATVYMCDASSSTSDCGQASAADDANNNPLVTTANAGSFSFGSVPVGQFTVWASDSGYVNCASGQTVTAGSCTGTPTVYTVTTLSPGTLPVATIALPAVSRSLSLTVTPSTASDNIAGASVTLTDGIDTFTQTVSSTAGTGAQTLTFPSVPRGCWTATLDTSHLSSGGTHLGAGALWTGVSSPSGGCSASGDPTKHVFYVPSSGGIDSASFSLVESLVTPTLTEDDDSFHQAPDVPVTVQPHGGTTPSASFNLSAGTCTASTPSSDPMNCATNSGTGLWLGPGSWDFMPGLDSATQAFWFASTPEVTVADTSTGTVTGSAAMTITENLGEVDVTVAAYNSSCWGPYGTCSGETALPGVTVTAVSSGGIRTVADESTNADGQVQLDLPAGAWTFSASETGYLSDTQSITLQAADVGVAGSMPTTDVTLNLKPMASVTVAAQDDSSVAVTGLDVTATRTVPDAVALAEKSALGTAITDTDNGDGTTTQVMKASGDGAGNYTFTDLPYGKSGDTYNPVWTVTATPSGGFSGSGYKNSSSDSVQVITTATQDSADGNAPTTLTLTRDKADVTFTVESAADSSPISGATVTVTGVGDCVTSDGTVGTLGECTIAAIPYSASGSYTATATLSGAGYDDGTGGSFNITTDGQAPGSSATTITMHPISADVTFTAQDDASTPNLLGGALVSVDGKQCTTDSTSSDAAFGQCTIAALPYSTTAYQATVTKSGYADGSSTFTVSTDSAVSAPTATLHVQATVKVTVEDASGNPIASGVTFTHSGAVNDGAGVYEFDDVGIGTFSTTVSATGYTDGSASATVTAADAGQTVTPTSATKLTAWTTGAIDFTASGLPSGSHTVAVSSTDQLGSTASFNKSGGGSSFNFTTLSYGHWNVTVDTVTCTGSVPISVTSPTTAATATITATASSGTVTGCTVS